MRLEWDGARVGRDVNFIPFLLLTGRGLVRAGREPMQCTIAVRDSGMGGSFTAVRFGYTPSELDDRKSYCIVY